MTDSARLRALLKQRHITQVNLANALGKHRASTNKKLMDVEQWRLTEISKVAECLQLTMLDAWEIFVAGHPLTEEEKAYLLPAPYGKLTEEEIDRIINRVIDRIGDRIIQCTVERLSQATAQKESKA